MKTINADIMIYNGLMCLLASSLGLLGCLMAVAPFIVTDSPFLGWGVSIAGLIMTFSVGYMAYFYCKSINKLTADFNKTQ